MTQSCRTSSLRTLAAVLAASSWLWPTLARADEVDDWFEKNAKDGLTAYSPTRLPPRQLYPRIHLYVSVFDQSEDKGLTGNLIIRPNNLRLDKGYGSTEVTYGRVWSGAVLPVLGRFFRASVQYDGKQGTIRLQPVADADVPKGVSFRPDSLILPSPIPNLGPGYTSFSTRSGIRGDEAFNTMLLVHAIDVPKGGKPTAAIGGGYNGAWPKVTVKVGDYLQLGGVGHEVLAIVPRDRAQDVFGWVELAGQPVPGATLANRKATVVNPRPKE